MVVRQSGVGKSRIVESVGRAACVVGYRVALHHQRRPAHWTDRPPGRHTLPKRLRDHAVLRLAHHRLKIRLRQDRTQRNLASRQLAVQDHRRTTPALDDGGDQHRLRRLGHLPGRPAVGDGLPRPCRGWRHHHQDQRPLLPCAPRRHEEDHRNQVTPTCPATIIPSTWIARIHRQAPVPSSLSHRDIGLLFDRDQHPPVLPLLTHRGVAPVRRQQRRALVAGPALDVLAGARLPPTPRQWPWYTAQGRRW